MSIAALITNENQVDVMLEWGKLLASTESTELLIIVFQKSRQKKQWIDYGENGVKENGSSLAASVAEKLSSLENGQPFSAETGEVQGDPQGEPPTKIRILRDPQPEWTLVNEMASLGIKLLLLPEGSVSKSDPDASSSWQSLYRRAPCETVQVRSRNSTLKRKLRVLVTTTGGRDDSAAIRRGSQIANTSGGEASVVYFEPDIDPVALDVGRKILKSIVETAVGGEASQIKQQVVIVNSFSKGLGDFDFSPFDVVICGTRNMRQSVRFLNHSVFQGEGKTFDAFTVREPIPMTSRFLSKLQDFFEGFIPQLKRDQRIELVRRIQSSSKWDFDFGVLICLSTLIAGLGLIRNSSSVVIGAMLVAPLMTPLVGAGLGLAQSNLQLLKTSIRTVFRGFATAFLIGILLGLCACSEVTTEMAARGSPNFLDLVVALVSGIAAAYALGRPNLLSALPGVAIAAALVPPLATSGMALAILEYQMSYGSLLLFCTNMVAIILGTTITFGMVGVRQARKEKRWEVWPLLLFLFFVILTIGLTVMMSFNGGASA